MEERALHSLQNDLAGVCGHVNAQHARLVRLTETALQEQAWKQIGVLSPSHWLAWQTGVANSTARKILTVAERACLHPKLMERFDAGELSLDQVAAAVRAPAYTDGEITNMARHMTVTQISRIVRQYPFHPDPLDPKYTPETPVDGEQHAAEPAPVPDQQINSQVAMWVDDTGTGQLRASLAPDHYRIVETALLEARDAIFQSSDAKVTWGDALVEIANRSLDTVTDPARRNRYRVNLFIHGEHPDKTVTFADGWRLPDALRDLLLCDSSLTPTYVIDGIPVNVGRSQHIVPDRTRRLVEHRDRGCRVPGCDQSRWTQVHHIIHWAKPDEGPTDTWNLICLCPRHHRLHHAGRLGITGNADLPPGTPGAVTFTDGRRRTIPPGPDPTAPGTPPPAPTGTYKHPLGERLNTWAIGFNPPHLVRRNHDG